MNSSFFIIADRGTLKAFRAVKSFRGRAPHLKLVDAFSFEEAHRSVSETFTDEARRFPIQTGAGPRATVQGNSIAERDYDIEANRRSAKQLAKHIADILHREQPGGWSFAAPTDIQEAVLAEVEPGFRKQLLTRLPRDLVKVPPEQLLEHFSAASAASDF